MKWNDFYTYYEQWPQATLLKKIDYLAEFPDSSQVINVAKRLNEDVASLLITKAANNGVAFSFDNIIEICYKINAGAIQAVIISYNKKLTIQQVIKIEQYSNRKFDVIFNIAKRAIGIKKISWQEFREISYRFSDRNLAKLIPLLTELGSKVEIMAYITSSGKESASKFAQKAVRNGIAFSQKDIVEISEYINTATLKAVLASTDINFTMAQMQEIELYSDLFFSDIVEAVKKPYSANGITWAEFNELRYDMSDEQLTKAVSLLNDFGTQEEISKLASYLYNYAEQALPGFIKNAINKGVNLNKEIIEQIIMLDNAQTSGMLAIRFHKKFSLNEVEWFEDYLSPSDYNELKRLKNYNFYANNQSKDKIGIFTYLLGGIGISMFLDKLFGKSD